MEVRNGELTVGIAAGKFPERREGLLAFAQQYARADEIVQSRKRALSFLDPTEAALPEPTKRRACGCR